MGPYRVRLRSGHEGGRVSIGKAGLFATNKHLFAAFYQLFMAIETDSHLQERSKSRRQRESFVGSRRSSNLIHRLTPDGGDYNGDGDGVGGSGGGGGGGITEITLLN